MPERARLLSFTAAALLEDCPLPQPGYGHIFLGAWGPILALSDQRHATRAPASTCPPTWTRQGGGDRAHPQRLPAASARGRARHAARSALDGGEIEIAANYTISTDECTVPGAALVGDAGGCSHPLTATGMTIALNDTRLLAEALARRRSRRSRRRSIARSRAIRPSAIASCARARSSPTRSTRSSAASTTARARSARASSATGTTRPARARARWRCCRATRAACRRSCASTSRWRRKSTSSVLRGEVNEPSMSGRMRSLVGLGKKTWEKLGLVARGVREGSLR